MGRHDAVRNGRTDGTTGGCLLNGCLVVLVSLLACFVGLWVWAATADDRAEGAARADLRSGAETGQEKLAGAVADGVLGDREIEGIFPRGKPAQGLVGIERHGPDVIVTAELLGVGPGVFLTGETLVTGCFTFTVTPEGRGHRGAEVVIRELAVEREPQSACTRKGAQSPSAFPSH
ncbi:hypothetical protein ACFQ9U_16845 [Streptomyces sp. NPDC056568]|uniref:hypothetical protein n=1 Tax=Streptomyces sp. NPDC056568 TaxID=3345866 RepID=UPI00369EBC18